MVRRAFLGVLLMLAPSSVAVAQPRSTDIAAGPWDGFIAEAAARFGVPSQWIREVMRAESGGHNLGPDGRPLVSRAGAIGLMQVMPATYAALARTYGFGPDPTVPRDNILAGAAYIRLMYDRFGSPGFLAAYNAGPGRYADHLATGAPLPVETRAYLATVSSRLGIGGGAPATELAAVSPDRLFATARAQPNPLFFALRSRGQNQGRLEQ